MLRFLQISVATFLLTWFLFYFITVLACQNGSESDLSLLDPEVFDGIHVPIYYWTDKIAEQALQGDLTARISFLDIVVRPQDCASNETIQLGPNDVQMKLRENFEQGFRISPPVCPPPAVKEWCDASFFGMRSVYFSLKGDKAIFPQDVSASYCCLETNRVGKMISQLRDNFDIFTFFIVFLFIIVTIIYYISRFHLWKLITRRFRQNRSAGARGDETEMEYIHEG